MFFAKSFHHRAARFGLALTGLGLFWTPSGGAGEPTLPPVNTEKADQLRQDLREMIALARDRVFPALVNIRVITVRYYDGRDQKGQAVGSGTIISREGHVLTNYHVVRNGKRFRCPWSISKAN